MYRHLMLITLALSLAGCGGRSEQWFLYTWEYGTSTWTLVPPGVTSVDGLADAVLQSELHQIEIMDGRLWRSAEGIAQLERLAEAGRVGSLHVQSGQSLDLASTAVGDATVAEYAQCAERLHALGGKVLVVHAGGVGVDESQREQAISTAAANVKLLSKICEPIGVCVAVENLPDPYLGCDVAELKRLTGDCAGVCLDTCHLWPTEAVLPTIQALAGRIVAVHLSDNRTHGDCHLMPSHGVTDWNTVLSALVEAGYRGPLLVEARSTAADIQGRVADSVRHARYLATGEPCRCPAR